MVEKNKVLVIDIDGTLYSGKKKGDYIDIVPNNEMINKLREYKQNGFRLILSSSRNMNTYNGNLGLINIHTLPKLIEWLNKHDIPYDEIYMGKPWCGFEGFYIDDKAIRPKEFINNTYEQIQDILKRDGEF